MYNETAGLVNKTVRVLGGNMYRSLLTALLALIIGGCVTAINEKNAMNYEQAGAAAQKRGDWDASRKAYARAANNADLANASPKKRAILHYEYGRSLGVTCFYKEAERELELAYSLDKQAGQPLYYSLVELARLNLDMKNYSQSVTYFNKAIQELDNANAATEAPIAYADILDEYSSALAGVGRKKEAIDVEKRASKIRGKNPKGNSITDRTPYGKQCTKP